METVNDYYNILGVNKNDEIDTIKKAYRKLALKYHPDRVSDDKKEEAEKTFKKIAEAYSILSNDRSRQIYDLGGGNISSDIFSSFFSNEGIDSLVNNFFSTQSTDAMNGLYDDILGGPDVKFSIHSFTEMPMFSDFENINFFDILNQSKATFSKMKENYKEKQNYKNKEKEIKNQPKNIDIVLKFELDDYVNNKSKIVKYTKHNFNIEEKCSQKIKLDNLNFSFENMGSNNGDLNIAIKLFEDKSLFKRVKDKIIIFINIDEFNEIEKRPYFYFKNYKKLGFFKISESCMPIEKNMLILFPIKLKHLNNIGIHYICLNITENSLEDQIILKKTNNEKNYEVGNKITLFDFMS